MPILISGGHQEDGMAVQQTNECEAGTSNKPQILQLAMMFSVRVCLARILSNLQTTMKQACGWENDKWLTCCSS